MSIAFLFPGQGSQRPGMLHRLPDTAASATVLAEADWALRRLVDQAGPGGGGTQGAGRPERADGIAELDTPEALEHSAVARQVALLIAGVAGARALIEDEEVPPGLVVGHGVGSYAAAVIAEVLTFEEALRAVRLRGELLDGADLSERDVAVRCAQHLATIERRAQKLPYVSGVYGRCLRNETNAVFDDLAQSVARPVRWVEMVGALAAEGTRCCVELPPGRVLTTLLATEGPAMRAVSVEEYGIAEAADFVREVVGLRDTRGAEDGSDPGAVPGMDTDWGTGRGGAGGWDLRGEPDAGRGRGTPGSPGSGPAQSGFA